MITKLRKKFILINMSLVLLVLLIVFGALGYSTISQARKDTKSALILAVSMDTGAPSPKPKIGPGGHRESFPMVPVFTVTVDASGMVTGTDQARAEVEESVIQGAVKAALSSGAAEGAIPSLGLRYLKTDVRDGMRIAFADTSSERAAVMRWLVNSLLAGVGGLTAFFLISFFLSRWALKPVEAAWERQRQFVADASHELKTPLTVILANTGILLRHREETVAQQVKWVEYTKDEAERMKKLVDELLFLAKSDAARSARTFLPVNFSDVAWNSVLPFESIAFEHHVALESKIAQNICLTGDEGQLKQLVAILMDNACKYAGEGGRVTVTLEKVQDKARLSVHNTGEPIPPDQLPRVFERFYRADSARAGGGYGLGLAIAKSIAEAHRGRITAESTKEAGTTFTVTLPMKS